MLWLYAEDSYYYSNAGIEKLKKDYNIKKFIIIPDFNDVKLYFNTSHDENIAFLAPFRPNKLSKAFDSSNFFSVIRIENYYEPFTYSQVELNMDKSEILSSLLGINIVKTDLSFRDYIGAERLIHEAKKIELKMISNLNPKGLFLVGLPGTGKSFFVKCFAGETKRILIELNFSKILENEKPIDKLNMIINYLQNNPNKYLVWIDEIEKMFSNENSQQILGAFLTMLNEFNTSKSNALFIATANNISDLSNKNPELFRTGGRFDKIIALKPPTEQNSKLILKHYFKSLEKLFKFDNFLSATMSIAFNFSTNYFENTNLKEFAKTFIENARNIKSFNHVIKDFSNYFNYATNKTHYINDENFKKQIKMIDTDDELFVLLKNIFINKFKTFYQSSLPLKETYDYYIEKFFFTNIDKLIEDIVYQVNLKYRDKSAINDRFPYTQAEIKTFSSEIYSNYFYDSISIESALNKTVNDIIPLQVQMSEQIKKMAQNIENYLQI